MALDATDSAPARSDAPPSYASYTYEHPSWLVRYPHLKRMRLVSGIITATPVASWLDYGAGDGAVAAYAYRTREFRPVRTVLYEPWDEIRGQIPSAAIPGVEIVGDLRPLGDARFDLITAFEVLEHLPLPERIRFYQYAASHLEPGGRCLIEIPVEYGPILLLKEYGRQFLKGRRTEYRLAELLKAAFLNAVEDSADRFDPLDTRTSISPHRGFDTTLFLEELAVIGDIASLRPSPFARLPAMLNQCLLIDFRPRVRDVEMIFGWINEFAQTVVKGRPLPVTGIDIAALQASRDSAGDG